MEKAIKYELRRCEEKAKDKIAEDLEDATRRHNSNISFWQENEKVYDTLDVREDLFCGEELATVLKRLTNNRALSADSVINDFLKYSGSAVKNKLLKIMNLIFEKGEVPNNFRKTLIKPLDKKGDKSEYRNYQGISLVSVGSKLLSIMILFLLRDAVDRVLGNEQCGFRKGKGCVDQILTLR